MFIQLFSKQNDIPVCDFVFRDPNQVSFRPPLEVGVHELFIDEEDGYRLGVSFPSIGGINRNAYNGFIEIISIDSTSVKGQIDPILDSSTYIKGTFEVDFCSQ